MIDEYAPLYYANLVGPDIPLVYTKDIDEEDISSHLSPAEMVNKEQIAAFFTKELISVCKKTLVF